VAFSPDGKWIVGVGPVGDQRFTWFDAATGRAERGVAIEPLPGGERSQTSVSSVAFTADGRTVVSAHDDGAIRVWDAVASRMTHRIAGAGTRVWWAQPSPDGRWLASGSEDGTVRVWELATGAELRQWDGHDGAVWDGVWGRDSRTLLTTAGSEAVLWSLRPPDLKPSTSANALWDDLVAEPAKAYRAQWNLLDDPKSAAKLLRDRQDPEKAPPDVKQVRRLISDLDSDNFRVREQAMKALRGLGKPVVPSLRDMQKAAGAEGGKRIGELIAEMTRALAPNDLRQVRAIQVLELAGTPDAVAVLKEWAGGLPGTLLTDEAAAAVKRIGLGR